LSVLYSTLDALAAFKVAPRSFVQQLYNGATVDKMLVDETLHIGRPKMDVGQATWRNAHCWRVVAIVLALRQLNLDLIAEPGLAQRYLGCLDQPFGARTSAVFTCTDSKAGPPLAKNLFNTAEFVVFPHGSF
jgi:hypothetical protein